MDPNTFTLQRQAESGGDPNARNPRSSATGPDQFIDATWREYAAAHPDRFQGMTDQQILARRTDPDESGRATQWLARENARTLAANGLPNGPGELTLAHRFGAAGAAAALRADPSAQVNVKLPATDFDALCAVARRQRCTAPELGRQAIARWLRRDDDEE